MNRISILSLSLMIALAGCASAKKSEVAQATTPTTGAATVAAAGSAVPVPQHTPIPDMPGWTVREPAEIKVGEFNVGDVLTTSHDLTWRMGSVVTLEGTSAKCEVKPIAKIGKNEELIARAGNDYVVVRKNSQGHLYFANMKDKKKAVFTVTCYGKMPMTAKDMRKGHRPPPPPPKDALDECYPWPACKKGHPTPGAHPAKPGPIYPIVTEKTAIKDALKDAFIVKLEVQPPPPKRIEINADEGETLGPATDIYDI